VVGEIYGYIWVEEWWMFVVSGTRPPATSLRVCSDP
jgi:hypothetical protein